VTRASTIGFVHTAEVHRATFDALVEDLSPSTTCRHVVDVSLLADAQSGEGVVVDLRERLMAAMHIAAEGADVLVCTCSTLGAAAEALADQVAVPVIRIDRPMARRAVELGTRVAVLATLHSTLTPTVDLIREVAAEVGAFVEVSVHLVDGAWSLFACGEVEASLDLVAQVVERCADAPEVIVLAQASMAPVTDRVSTTVPVLSSPRLAVEAALRAIPQSP
jgi:aspartate/glutamate racemase